MAQLKIFVACPYLLFPMDDYKSVFNTIRKSYSVEFQFADEQITNQHILSKITNYIRDADISIFDITGWNPNVTLELGIAVGMGKRYFILFNQKFDQNREVPSDIKGIDRIQYSSNLELESQLIILIKQILPQSNDRVGSAFETLKGRIIEALTENPGLNVSKISEVISEDKILIQTAVRSMVLDGELKTRGQKKGMRYFSKETDLRTVPRA